MHAVSRALFVLGALATAPVAAESVESMTEAEREVQAETRSNQKQVSDLAEDARALLQEYRQVRDRIRAQEEYNELVAERVRRQESTLSELESRLARLDETREAVGPLMVDMADHLEDAIRADHPFDRAGRLAELEEARDKLGSPDADAGEQYRALLDAYEKELRHGYRLGVTRGPGPENEREVEYVHVGRISLFYRTLDGEKAAFWDGSGWQDFTDPEAVARAIAVAREERAPDFVPAMVRIPDTEEQ